MDNTTSVSVSKCRQGLSNVLCTNLYGEAALTKQILKCLALQEFHHQNQMALPAKGIVHGGNVGMVQA
jgi:hypothetical protein